MPKWKKLKKLNAIGLDKRLIQYYCETVIPNGAGFKNKIYRHENVQIDPKLRDITLNSERQMVSNGRNPNFTSGINFYQAR